jgi:hypothetical protein
MQLLRQEMLALVVTAATEVPELQEEQVLALALLLVTHLVHRPTLEVWWELTMEQLTIHMHQAMHTQLEAWPVRQE